MKLLATLAALAALGIAVALATIQLGLAPVAATEPHWKVTRWVLSTAMEKAVERQAAGIAVPGDLDDPERIRAGAAEYDEMCVACHAAPGTRAAEFAEGLLPEAPELAEEAEEWGPAELFWITRHGVRMTGMAAFGPTHSDAELWDVVAFVRQLPEMSPAGYRALVESAAGMHSHGDEEGDGNVAGHGHDEGESPEHAHGEGKGEHR